MLEHLQSRIPGFGKRLAETIAWCSAQVVEANPAESTEIQERRTLGAQAADLSRRAFLSEGPDFWKAHLTRRARNLFRRARLGEIIPLAQQLRSPVLDPGHSSFPSDDSQTVSIVEALATKRAEELRRAERSPPLSRLTSEMVGSCSTGRTRTCLTEQRNTPRKDSSMLTTSLHGTRGFASRRNA